MTIEVGDRIEVIVRGVMFSFDPNIHWVHIRGDVIDKNEEFINIQWIDENNINDILERTNEQLLPLVEQIKLEDLEYLDWDKGSNSLIEETVKMKDGRAKTIYRFDKKTTRNKKIDIALK